MRPELSVVIPLHNEAASVRIRLIRAVKPHGGLIVLLFFIILVHGGPHVIFQKTLAAQGLPYYPMLANLDERHFTAAKVNAVFRDGAVSGDINLFEHRGTPYVMPPLPHLIMGYLSRALGSIKAGFIAGDIIFPAVSFLLLYLLGFELTRKKTFAALFASVSFFITRTLLFFPLLTPYHRAYIFTHTLHLPSRLYFDRFEDPILTAPFFFLALYLLLRTLTREERWMPVLAGVSAGLVWYAYFFYAVYLFTALVILISLTLLQKNMARFKKIMTVVAVGLITSSLYWINFVALTRLPTYADIVSRIGPEHSFAPFLYLVPMFAYVQHTLLAFILYLMLRRESPGRAAFMTALLLPVFVVYNFQIITGFNPQPDHWIKPRQFVLTLSFLYLGFLILKNHPRILRPAYLLPGALLISLFLFAKGLMTQNGSVKIISFGAITSITILAGAYVVLRRTISLTPLRFAGTLSLAVIVVLCIKGFLTARAFTERNLAAATISPAEDASYRWLNANTRPESVIGSISATTNNHLQLFTANHLFISGTNNTTASNKELFARFMILNRLFGVNPNAFGSYFPTDTTYPPKDEDHSAVGYLFGGRFTAQTPGSIFTNQAYGPPKWSADHQREAVDEYRRITKEMHVSIPYRLDYLYYGPRERAFTQGVILRNPALKTVYENDDIEIYIFVPK